jgi:hypothetical protein
MHVAIFPIPGMFGVDAVNHLLDVDVARVTEEGIIEVVPFLGATHFLEFGGEVIKFYIFAFVSTSHIKFIKKNHFSFKKDSVK